jgi:hypothetical protein
MKARILLNYENKWVALSKDRSKVLYAAKSLDGLFKVLPESKKDDVILHYVPPFDGHLSM